MSFFSLYLISAIFFFVIKAANFGVRLSDINIYFYTAYQIISGKLLYKDIFFTNLPLFPYLSAVYFFLVNRSLTLYYLTATIEVILTGGLIFFIIRLRQMPDGKWFGLKSDLKPSNGLILRERSNKEFIPLMGSLLYLFSFIILTTSDHQTGVFATSFLAVLAYYLTVKRRYFMSGLVLAAALLIKAYYIPIVLAFILYLFPEDRKATIKWLVGFLLTVSVVLIPFFFFASQEFLSAIFKYSVIRGAGLSKINILLFFIIHDPLLFILLLFNLINIKRNHLLFYISLLSLLFIFFYQDIYYLYLNLLVPFLVLGFTDLYQLLNKYVKKKLSLIVCGILGMIFLFNLYSYFANFFILQKVVDIDSLMTTIKKEKPSYLYGENDITPALSYLTGIPMLSGIIDTNANMFRIGLLNVNRTTNVALKNRTILVIHGIDYPQQKMKDELFTEIIDKKKIQKKCQLIESQPVKTENIVNRVNLFKCY
jgi:hypothetical protein